ncbi:hypothetical protein ACHAXN_007459 [Cyclotella atomus]
MEAPSNSELWLAAISNAERQKNYEPSSAVDYLLHLKDLLTSQDQSQWNRVPFFPPPRPIWENATNGLYPEAIDPYTHLQRSMANQDDAFVDQIASSVTMLNVGNDAYRTTAVSNHYAVFDDDVSDEEIVYNPPNHNTHSNNDAPEPVSSVDKQMSMRRILLRVYCSLAEIHSTWAVECSKNRRWADGADEFENAYNILRSGQEIIDEEHASLAQMMEMMETIDGDTARLERDINERQKCIDMDSEVVSVPLSFFTLSQNKYVHAAQSRIRFLEDKLYEYTASRDGIKARMGSRWKTNPHPSNDYAERRKALEKELDEALDGVNRTQRMNVGGLGGRRY